METVVISLVMMLTYIARLSDSGSRSADAIQFACLASLLVIVLKRRTHYKVLLLEKMIAL